MISWKEKYSDHVIRNGACKIENNGNLKNSHLFNDQFSHGKNSLGKRTKKSKGFAVAETLSTLISRNRDYDFPEIYSY